MRKVYGKRNKIIQGYTASKHPLYQTYNGMIKRCYCETDVSYKNYGAKNIKVSKEWLESFETFATDMGLKPSKEHSLDRIDNNLGYSKENCKWSTRIEQNENKGVYRTNKLGSNGITVTKSGVYKVRQKNTRKNLGVFKDLESAINAQLTNSKQIEPRITNTTGHRGINRHSNGTFTVRRIINGERVYLGNTQTIEEAISLYNQGTRQNKSNSRTGHRGIIQKNGFYIVRKTIKKVRIYLGKTETLEEALKLYESANE